MTETHGELDLMYGTPGISHTLVNVTVAIQTKIGEVGTGKQGGGKQYNERCTTGQSDHRHDFSVGRESETAEHVIKYLRETCNFEGVDKDKPLLPCCLA